MTGIEAPATAVDPSKSVSRSVSMPLELWAVVEQYAKDQNHDRSSWLRSLAVPELERAGVWPVAGGLAVTDLRQASLLQKLEALAALNVDVDQVLQNALEAAGATPLPFSMNAKS